ncbi:NADH-dependent flavin oxidoreductase [Lacicoccus alkaliphilus]|uniref:2,4-dienoyl-CoA reductase n=1 Tax=Lacicoccus alkaliphilus DSM 16010 TaxID=1123231 RepID=A0A1M7DSR8_9BACL|nr:NADH-dependent flavin oxidoreductase [Salinicoccus alkaliphilus]SHL82506.1 2,4-dienoyl-CoA reductase [Salinicoccus alkaliphilus DSM 16010]
MSKEYKNLFQDFTFKSGVHVRNRLMMPPMTTFSADENDFVSDEELAYYEERANGVGTIITACAYVSDNGKGFEGQMSIAGDETIGRLRALSDVIHEGGAKGIVQLYHGGRLAVPHLTPGGETVSASAVVPLSDRGFYSIDQTPRALETEEVYEIIEDFAQAARRSIEAGFDGVELHGATGYLLQQFVSPHSNLRTDEFQDRHLFALKLIEAVKQVVAEHAVKPFMVGYRFSPEEPETPGITMKETFEFLDALIETDALDYLHMAATDAWSPARRGVDSEKSRTELIAGHVDGRLPVIGVGSILTARDASAVLEKGGMDFAAVGRALVVDPKWVDKIRDGEEEAIIDHLTEHDRTKAVIPAPLWKHIMEVEGWFPVKRNADIMK